MRNGLAEIREERRYIVRDIDAAAMLERFLVSAVVSLLLLRFYLEITGFPQIGGGGLHIAHLLWGGLLMLVALVLLLAFFGKTVQALAAIVGGIGFGLFIDEVGKFVTSNNNYFFQPAIALIYVVFVCLFLIFRAIERQQIRSEQGYLINALMFTGEAIVHGYDRNNRDRALALLANVPPENPIGHALRETLLTLKVVPNASPGRLVRFARWCRETYRQIVEANWFTRGVLVLFGTYAAGTVIVVVAIVVATLHQSPHEPRISLDGEIGFTALSDLLILIGALLWLKSRLRAMIWFERGVLASLLLTQPFLFYTQQLPALAWLVVDLLMLEGLQYMIRQERAHERALPAGSQAQTQKVIT